jgi:hypothetical protein
MNIFYENLFERLYPEWINKLKDAIKVYTSLNIRYPCRCIVGEAWGFGNRYHYEERCGSCIEFSYEMSNYINMKTIYGEYLGEGAWEKWEEIEILLGFSKIKVDFVKHHHEKHLEDERCKFCDIGLSLDKRNCTNCGNKMID